MLVLEFPDVSHKARYEEMVAEWKAHEVPESPATLFLGNDYSEFLQLITNKQTTPPEGKVPASLFFLVDTVSSRVLGAIDIRHNIENEYLQKYWWHIGYGIRPSERRKGLATKMLTLGLSETNRLGIDPVMISCYDENIWSAKVIEANGGVLRDIVDLDGKKLRRYFITQK